MFCCWWTFRLSLFLSNRNVSVIILIQVFQCTGAKASISRNGNAGLWYVDVQLFCTVKLLCQFTFQLEEYESFHCSASSQYYITYSNHKELHYSTPCKSTSQQLRASAMLHLNSPPWAGMTLKLSRQFQSQSSHLFSVS